jgi:hypothetical protein
MNVIKGSLTQECRLDFFLTNHIPPARPLSNTHIGAISNFFENPLRYWLFTGVVVTGDKLSPVCCYRQKIIAGVVDKSRKTLFQIFIDVMKPRRFIAGNNDTAAKR